MFSEFSRINSYMTHIKKKIQKNLQKDVQKAVQKKCKNCGDLFVHNIRVHCSKNCTNEYVKKSLIAKREKKFDNGIEGVDFLKCPICQQKIAEITYRHAKMHGFLSIKEFLEKFMLASNKCQKQCDRLKGENNPGYRHGGKFSPFSKKFKKYKKLKADEIDEKIKKTIAKSCKTHDDNHSRSTRIDYYTSRGFTEEQARIELSKRQTTFSLEICIEKYGKEEGLKRWEDRQNKWQDSLNSLPQEEKDRIYKLRVAGFDLASKSSYSKISQKMFSTIEKHVSGIFYGKNEKSLEIQNKIIKPDCLLEDKKKIIEFYGDHWHANPNKFSGDQLHPRKKIPIKEIWEHDAARIDYLKNAGYDVMIVWESEYHKNKKETVQKCIKFLNGDGDGR